MNKQLLDELVDKAGFVLWQDEPWRPESGWIDWNTSYDQELERLVQLVVRHCAKTAHVHNLTGDYYTGRRDAAQLILKHWDLEAK